MTYDSCDRCAGPVDASETIETCQKNYIELGTKQMLTKETEEIIMKYSGLLKNIDEDISSLKAKLEVNRLETLDLMHEADPRNHIVGLPKKRKVDSRVAMSLGLKLKELSMAHRDLKDDLAALEVIRQQFPKGSKSELAVYNVANFVQCGKSRKYMRRAREN